MVDLDHTKANITIDRIALIFFAAGAIQITNTIWFGIDLQSSIYAPFAIIIPLALALGALALALSEDYATRHAPTYVFLAASTIIVIYSLYKLLQVSPGFGSDALLFTRYAVDLVLHGQNPYTTTMMHAYHLFSTRNIAFTPTTNGGQVANFNYPIITVLYYVPFVALGVADIRLANILLTLALIAILYYAAPRKYKPLTPLLLFSIHGFLLLSVASNDPPFVVLFTGAVVAWELYDRRGLSGLLLGLSAAAKQMAWFAVPFFAYRVIRHARQEEATLHDQAREVALIGSLTLLGFIAPNLPWLAISPIAWIRDVFTPLLGSSSGALVVYGLGVSVFQEAGFVSPPSWLYAVLMILMYACLLGLYHRYFDQYEDIMWAVTPFVMFVNYRGLGKYYSWFLPLALIIIFGRFQYQRKLLTIGNISLTPPPRRAIRTYAPAIIFSVLLITAGASITALGGGLTSRPNNSVGIHIVNQDDPHNLGRTTQITANLTNYAPQQRTVSVATNALTANVYYWNGGNKVVLNSSETKQVTLTAPAYKMSLPNGEKYRIRATLHGKKDIVGTSAPHTARSSYPAVKNPDFQYLHWVVWRHQKHYPGWNTYTWSPDPHGAKVWSKNGSATLAATTPTNTSNKPGRNRSIAALNQHILLNSTVHPKFNLEHLPTPHKGTFVAQAGFNVVAKTGELRILYERGRKHKKVQTGNLNNRPYRFVRYPASDAPQSINLTQRWKRYGWKLPNKTRMSESGNSIMGRKALLRIFVAAHPDATKNKTYAMTVKSFRTKKQIANNSSRSY